MKHVPTRLQVKAMAYFDRREPSSYLLDRRVNFVPELPLGDPDSLGRHALRFTGEDAGSGRRVDLLALPDGGAGAAGRLTCWRYPTAARLTCSECA